MLRWWCWRPGPVERDAGAGVRPLGAGGSIHEVPPAVGGSRWEGGCAQWQKKRPARDRCAVEQRRSRSGRICVCPHVRVLESNRNEQKGERRRKKTREIVAGGGRLPAAVPPKARERYRQSRKLLRWLLGSLCSQTQTHTHTHTHKVIRWRAVTRQWQDVRSVSAPQPPACDPFRFEVRQRRYAHAQPSSPYVL